VWAFFFGAPSDACLVPTGSWECLCGMGWDCGRMGSGTCYLVSSGYIVVEMERGWYVVSMSEKRGEVPLCVVRGIATTTLL
jgi:hypothetical protein